MMSEELRLPEDQVTSEYLRQEIDRDIGQYSGEMLDQRKNPLIGAALEILRAKGKIAVLDVGCGTGRALYGLRDQLLFQTKVDEEKVITVGLNNQDFSEESEIAAVRKAIREKKVKYIVGDFLSPPLEEVKFDLIVAYESLVELDLGSLQIAVKNLLGLLKQGGFLYLDLRKEQRRIFALLDSEELRIEGYRLFEYEKQKGKDTRIFIQIKKSEKTPE